MKVDAAAIALLLLSSTPSLAAPQPVTDIQTRDVAAVLDVRNVDISNLWKRKGGGGGGARGGSGSSSSGSSGYVPSPSTEEKRIISKMLWFIIVIWRRWLIVVYGESHGWCAVTIWGIAEIVGFHGTIQHIVELAVGTLEMVVSSRGTFSNRGPEPIVPVVVLHLVEYHDSPWVSDHSGGGSSRKQSSGLLVQGIKLESISR